ncbi:conserved hypothetical protein [Candidatus Desulfosporosinus infrequens]|uniref:Uncharacterized protein n=1 Tax=Candidatus Desulfosporosinus infrequens TaxID=2043169 RepID=A0A2U3LX09_9FIRM|nr:conserved hypothetical protein [Candidatus Desulfosporosinus infrequens]
MAEVMSRNPDLKLKLATASMVINIASAKLYAYNKAFLLEIAKDAKFHADLKMAYENCGEDERAFAELFATVSYEADNLILKNESEG